MKRSPACLDDIAHGGPIPAACCPCDLCQADAAEARLREQRALREDKLRKQLLALLRELEAVTADPHMARNRRQREQERLQREIAPINAELATLRGEGAAASLP